MEKRIYVGNLPFSVTQEKLKELFSKYGEIEEAIVIANKFSGRSKGFGFVSFKDESSAEKAIAEMNKKEVEGRPLNVKEAVPFDENKPRRRFKFKKRFRRKPEEKEESFEENTEEKTKENQESSEEKPEEENSPEENTEEKASE